MAYPQDDTALRDILTTYRNFAVVGASNNPSRPSYGVMAFLLRKGYHVVPVNPGQVGKEILGQPVYAKLDDVPGPLEVVDIFREKSAIPGVVDDAIRLGAKAVWMQLGLEDDEARDRAEAAGLAVVMNRCPAIEIPRLGI